MIYEALSIPKKMFTVMFAVAHIASWMAQWNDMQERAESKIYNPRQLYVGYQSRPHISVDQR
ncbi:citrate synthase family protein [Orientia tsutsugamushi str. Sido]|nr:citrate synthase family protein [Orientia tsutsugamushi str. Sido]